MSCCIVENLVRSLLGKPLRQVHSAISPHLLIGPTPQKQDIQPPVTNEYYWICEPCFNDFREMFEWKVSSSSGNYE